MGAGYPTNQNACISDLPQSRKRNVMREVEDCLLEFAALHQPFYRNNIVRITRIEVLKTKPAPADNSGAWHLCAALTDALLAHSTLSSWKVAVAANNSGPFQCL